MRKAVEAFAKKHRINRSEAVRALITEALPRLDSELDRKFSKTFRTTGKFIKADITALGGVLN